jgi:hypothetical protein
MPVLDNVPEVTASLLKLPGGRGGKFKLPTLGVTSISFRTNQKRTMQLPTLKQQHDVFELIRTEILPKKN